MKRNIYEEICNKIRGKNKTTEKKLEKKTKKLFKRRRRRRRRNYLKEEEEIILKKEKSMEINHLINELMNKKITTTNHQEIFKNITETFDLLDLIDK